MPVPPRCSILIPAFNEERYIANAVESALAQTWREKEVIVVNDGSTDRTKERLEPYLDRIVYLEQPNRGLAAARNAALSRASGEFIALLDADDLWFPNRLDRMVDFMQARQDVTIATSNAYLVGEEPTSRTYYGHRVERFHEEDQLLWLLHFNFVFIMTFVRRRVFDDNGPFDESLKTCEDWEAWIRYVGLGEKIGFLDEPLGFYRVREGSLSRSSDFLFDHVNLPETALVRLPFLNPRGLGRDFYLPFGKEALKRGELPNARRLLKSAAKDSELQKLSRAKSFLASLSPKMARMVWSDLLFEIEDSEVVDSKGVRYAITPNAAQGFVDAVRSSSDRDLVTGWAINPESLTAADRVIAFSGGRFLGWTAPRHYRPDIARVYGAKSLLSGFVLRLGPGSIGRPGQLRILAQFGHTTSELANAGL